MEIRKFTEGEVEALLHLFLARGLEPEPELLRWKLLNPCHIGYCATDSNDEILAYYSLLEVEIEGTSRAAMAVDALTHPDHSNFELLYSVMQKCYEEAEREGIELLLGVPTRVMSRIMSFIGWKPLPKHLVLRSRGRDDEPELLPGYGLSIKSDYLRWRWELCPRSYSHADIGKTAVFAYRPNLFRAIMLMNGDMEICASSAACFDCCFLMAEEKAPEGLEIMRELPILYMNLGEKKDSGEPAVSIDFSLVEALTLGW